MALEHLRRPPHPPLYISVLSTNADWSDAHRDGRDQEEDIIQGLQLQQ